LTVTGSERRRCCSAGWWLLTWFGGATMAEAASDLKNTASMMELTATDWDLMGEAWIVAVGLREGTDLIWKGDDGGGGH
jgi:hypothetical protein